MNRRLLDEQVQYYRARAPEYDRWFHRIGPYDLGPEENARWFAEVDLVRNALLPLGPVDRALELASGTGLWTQQLEPMCSTITAVDASPEMLDLNRQRLGSDRVTYVEAASRLTLAPSIARIHVSVGQNGDSWFAMNEANCVLALLIASA